MKYLIISDVNSIYTKTFAENVLLPNRIDFSFATINNSVFSNYYTDNNIDIINYSVVKNNNYFYKIINTINLIKIIKKTNYDCLILQYVHIYMLILFRIFKVNKPMILEYWGSDISRVERPLLLCVKKLVKESYKIVTDAEYSAEELCNVYGKEIMDNIEIIRFANKTIDSIKDKLNFKKRIKESFFGKKNLDKRIITIGYNASKAQNHIEIIKQLIKLNEKEKENILFVFPLTYPENSKYIETIKRVLENSKLNYRIITKYMDKNEMADLCVITDVFVHAQKTDSMSSSMIEFIYAGATIVNASWLHYKLLEENGIQSINFNNFDEINSIITKEQNILYNIDEIRKILENEYSSTLYEKKWKIILKNMKI